MLVAIRLVCALWLPLIIAGCTLLAQPAARPNAPASSPSAGALDAETTGASAPPPPAATEVRPQWQNNAGHGGAPSPTPAGRAVPITVALDPGHGGPEPGAYTDEVGLVEKELNLRVALELAALLRETGFRVVLTREDDRAVSPTYVRWGDEEQVRKDLQARIDIANAARADLLLSIHHNGAFSPFKQGVEVWYNRDRPFSDRNERLATLVRDHVLRALAWTGYAAMDGGVLHDSAFDPHGGDPGNLYLLQAGRGAEPHTPTLMPGALGETLYVTNPEDAEALQRPETLTAIARGYFQAVVDYVAPFPDTGQRWPITMQGETAHGVQRAE